MIRGGLLLIALLLGSCTVGPDYVAPSIDAPDQFVSQEVFTALNEGKPGQVTDGAWWKDFNDPLLTRLVEATIENNQQIASAIARVRAAKANVRLTDAADALQSDAGAEITGEDRNELGNNDTDETSGSISGGLSVTLPLDVFGRNRRQVEAARAALESAEAELRNIVLFSSSDVVGEYLRLRGNQRQLELLRQSVALQEKTLTIVRSRFESGLSPELDLRRAETTVERLRADIPPLLESLTNSRNRIAALTGEYPGSYEDLLKNEQDIPAYQGRIPVQIPVDTLRQRPDIQQVEAELKRSVAEIGVAEAAYYPVFLLFSQLSIGTSGISGQPGMDLIIGTLGALVDQIISDGGARAARVDIARARADEALADYRQALLDASQSVETTLTALKTSQERQKPLERAVESSSRSFSQAERLYQLGLSSFLDVVDAQRELASAEQQLASERTNYATQVATLFRVLGRTPD